MCIRDSYYTQNSTNYLSMFYQVFEILRGDLSKGVFKEANANPVSYTHLYFARFAKLNRYALAYENQLEPELEVLDTDIKMYRIYTEESEYKII